MKSRDCLIEDGAVEDDLGGIQGNIWICRSRKTLSEFIDPLSHNQHCFSESANLSLYVLRPVTCNLLQGVEINNYLVRVWVVLQRDHRTLGLSFVYQVLVKVWAWCHYGCKRGETGGEDWESTEVGGITSLPTLGLTPSRRAGFFPLSITARKLRSAQVHKTLVKEKVWRSYLDNHANL